MRRATVNNTAILIASLLVCLIACEFVVRYFVTYSEHDRFEQGYFYVPLVNKGSLIPPYYMDISGIEKRIQRFQKSTESTLVYDSDLGWTYRPSTVSSDSRLIHNQDGIRTASLGKNYETSASPNHLRIAIFGDSFSHGDGVAFTNTWANRLENSLNKGVIKAEVLNFGVGGYGMDQAYLRYQKIGKQFSPSVVIFGFAIENMLRNLNIFRNIYKRAPQGIVFSKPRFILDQDTLQIVNQPTIDPALISHTLSNLASSDLKNYETFYSATQYEPQWWHVSKLICLGYAIFQRIRLNTFSLRSETSQLTIQIIKEFKKEVETNGGIFVVVHLPPKTHLQHYINSGAFKYEDILEQLENLTNLIRPETKLEKHAYSNTIDSLYGDHYSPIGHEIIGDHISYYLYNNLKINHIDGSVD